MNEILYPVALDTAPAVTGEIDRLLSPYLFPVEQREVAYSTSRNTSGIKEFSSAGKYKSIVDVNSNELISIQPSTYKLVTNREVIMPLMEQLHQIDNKWVIDPSHSFVDRKRMRLQITFPELTVEDDSGKNGIALSWFVHNSYDASEGVRSYWGGIRGVCSNGTVFGHLLSKYYHRHTRGINLRSLQSEIEATYNRIPVLEERIRILMDMQVEKEDLSEVNRISVKMGQYVAEHGNMHMTRWMLLNLMTYYISHYVQLHMRARYQFEVSRMFGL